ALHTASTRAAHDAARPGDLHDARRAADAHDAARPGDAAGPARDAAAPVCAADLDVMQHASSLAPVRDGALFMEQTYYAWDLETTGNQPLSLGVMNSFARWAYAPLFRMWWPLVRSTLTPQFARFMETQFGLERIPPH